MITEPGWGETRLGREWYHNSGNPFFSKLSTSNQSTYQDESNDVKFGFGVNLLNMMASAVRGARGIIRSSYWSARGIY